MNKVQTQPAPPSLSRSAPAIRGVVVAVLVATVFVASLLLVEGPRFVDRVTIVNRSDLALDVDTAASRTDGWTPAGVALPGGTTTFDDVVDHGETWVIRLTNGGRSVVVQVPRAQLEQSGWRVTVPASVQAELEAQIRDPT